jgi:hypothetical protein
MMRNQEQNQNALIEQNKSSSNLMNNNALTNQSSTKLFENSSGKIVKVIQYFHPECNSLHIQPKQEIDPITPPFIQFNQNSKQNDLRMNVCRNPKDSNSIIPLNQKLNPSTKRELTSLQKNLKTLQDLAKRFNHPISGKKIKSVMMEVFLSRFPHGNDLCHGNVSRPNRIKKTSVDILTCAIREWIQLEGYENVKLFFDHVIHRENLVQKCC